MNPIVLNSSSFPIPVTVHASLSRLRRVSTGSSCELKMIQLGTVSVSTSGTTLGRNHNQISSFSKMPVPHVLNVFVSVQTQLLAFIVNAVRERALELSMLSCEVSCLGHVRCPMVTTEIHLLPHSDVDSTNFSAIFCQSIGPGFLMFMNFLTWDVNLRPD